MKKLLSVAFALLLVASTFALTACTEKPSTSSSKAENSQSVALLSPTPTPTPIPTELTEEELNIYYGDDKRMEYAEFMAEERLYDGTATNEEFFTFDEELNKVVKIQANTGNIIETYEKDWGKPFISRKGNSVYVLLDGTKLVRVDENLENMQTLVEFDFKMDHIRTTNDMIFIVGDTAMYRFHIKSRTLEKMYENEKASFMYPISNIKLLVDILHDDAYQELKETGKISKAVDGFPRSDSYIYDTVTGESAHVMFNPDTGKYDLVE